MTPTLDRVELDRAVYAARTAMPDNPAIKALTTALRDNAADLTEQDKAVREAEATYNAAHAQMTALRDQREGLQAALAFLRSSVSPSA